MPFFSPGRLSYSERNEHGWIRKKSDPEGSRYSSAAVCDFSVVKRHGYSTTREIGIAIGIGIDIAIAFTVPIGLFFAETGSSFIRVRRTQSL
jgi:hypothetical protein